MKILVLLYFFNLTLYATCSHENVAQAKVSYMEAMKAKTQKSKIKHLQKALGYCYSAEIEANLFILKAEQNSDVNTQIRYYKKSLISVSQFKNRHLIVSYQNDINLKLATLFEHKNTQISNIYKSKHMKLLQEEYTEHYVWIYFIFTLLFLWGIYKSIKK